MHPLAASDAVAQPKRLLQGRWGGGCHSIHQNLRHQMLSMTVDGMRKAQRMANLVCCELTRHCRHNYGGGWGHGTLPAQSQTAELAPRALARCQA